MVSVKLNPHQLACDSIENVLNTFNNLRAEIVSFNIGHLSATQSGINFSLDFLFHIPPEISMINFQWREMAGYSELAQSFILPMPRRYLNIGVNVTNSTN